MGEIKTMEGFGLPGAGKSTCIAALKKDTRKPESLQILVRKEGDSKFLDIPNPQSSKKRQNLLEIYLSLAYLLSRPAFFILVIRSMIIFKLGKNFLSVLRSLIIALYTRSKLKVENTEGDILLDEGLVQFIGSLVVESNRNKQLPKQLIKYVLSNYIQALIYFDVDFDDAIIRIKKRNDGKSRFDKMNNENAILNLRKMQKTFTICINEAKNLNIPVLELKRGNSINENAELTLSFLKELQ